MIVDDLSERARTVLEEDVALALLQRHLTRLEVEPPVTEDAGTRASTSTGSGSA